MVADTLKCFPTTVTGQNGERLLLALGWGGFSVYPGWMAQASLKSSLPLPGIKGMHHHLRPWLLSFIMSRQRMLKARTYLTWQLNATHSSGLVRQTECLSLLVLRILPGQLVRFGQGLSCIGWWFVKAKSMVLRAGFCSFGVSFLVGNTQWNIWVIISG